MLSDNLIGKTVNKLYVYNYDQSELVFFTDDNNIYDWNAFGDCCSESWFYHVLGVDNLLGFKILKVEEHLEQDATDNYSRQEFDRIYKVTITTTRGYCDIEFRNSSNGYYSGWATEAQIEDEDFSYDAFSEIKEDWTAFLNV